MKKYRSIILFMILVLIIGTLSSCKSNSSNISDALNKQVNKDKADITDKLKNITNVNNPVKQSNISNKSENTNRPAVVYRGITLDNIDGNVDYENLTDDKQKRYLKEKYEKDYYLYSNGNLIGKAKGKIEGSGLDSWWQVNFPNEFDKYEVAITQDYNPYPRKIEFINPNTIKQKVINEVNTQFNVIAKVKELCTVDLDGDGLNEYLALFADENNYFFAKCLLDSNYRIISFITVFKEKQENFSTIIEEFNLVNACEIIDIDNDNIMEVIVNIPSYEGVRFKVFKYNQGKIDGDFINQGSFKP